MFFLRAPLVLSASRVSRVTPGAARRLSSDDHQGLGKTSPEKGLEQDVDDQKQAPSPRGKDPEVRPITVLKETLAEFWEKKPLRNCDPYWGGGPLLL